MRQEDVKKKMLEAIETTLDNTSSLSKEMKDLSEEMTKTGEKYAINRDARIRLFGTRVQDKNGTIRAATAIALRS